MSDKCFCHLGEFEVKDAQARNDLIKAKIDIENLERTTIKTTVAENLIKRVSALEEEDCEVSATDFNTLKDRVKFLEDNGGSGSGGSGSVAGPLYLMKAQIGFGYYDSDNKIDYSYPYGSFIISVLTRKLSIASMYPDVSEELALELFLRDHALTGSAIKVGGSFYIEDSSMGLRYINDVTASNNGTAGEGIRINYFEPYNHTGLGNKDLYYNMFYESTQNMNANVHLSFSKTSIETVKEII